MLFCGKLREWVWTATGTGDRVGGDRRLGPSPPSERPAPPHSLQTGWNHTRGRPASLVGLLCCSRLFCKDLPCHASSACLCHHPMPASPCLRLPLCPSITMCARNSQFCKDCPAGSPCIHHVQLFCDHLYPFPCTKDFAMTFAFPLLQITSPGPWFSVNL